jgi:hypothetical protein
VHKKIELVLRPLPVFTGKAIQRKLIQVQTGGFLNRAADAGDPAAVPFDSRQVLPLGAETAAAEGFTLDPVGDSSATLTPASVVMLLL